MKKYILTLLFIHAQSSAGILDSLSSWSDLILNPIEDKMSVNHEPDQEYQDPNSVIDQDSNPDETNNANSTLSEDESPLDLNLDGSDQNSDEILHSSEVVTANQLIPAKITTSPDDNLNQNLFSIDNKVDISNKVPIEFIASYEHNIDKAIPDSYIINEDEGFKFNPLDNDLIHDNDNYQLISIGEVSNADVNINGNIVTLIPSHNFNGDILINYIIANSENNILSSKIKISVMPVNDWPIAKDDLILTQEDTPLIVPSLVENDTDPDGDNIKTIKISDPVNGHINKDSGVLLYTPNKDFYGIEEMNYTISDEKGAIASAKFTILVKATNDAPVATDDEYQTPEDTFIKISNFLTNDVDVDGDLFYLKSHTQPSYGVIRFNGKSFIYTPEHNFNGIDYFYYTISDTKATMSTAKIEIEVTPLNDEPLTKDDGPYYTKVSTPLYLPSIMDNDSDVDGDKFGISSYTRPLNGELSFDNKFTFIYIPNPGFVGVDRFTYTITDGNNTSDLSSVKLIVNSNLEESNISVDTRDLASELYQGSTPTITEDAPSTDDNLHLEGSTDIENDILNRIKSF